MQANITANEIAAITYLYCFCLDCLHLHFFSFCISMVLGSSMYSLMLHTKENIEYSNGASKASLFAIFWPRASGNIAHLFLFDC